MAQQAMLLCVLAPLLVAGCKEATEGSADRVEIVSGNNQAGLPGRFFPEPLVVRVLGPRNVDFLGKRGRRQPVAGVPVTFKVSEKDRPDAGGSTESREDSGKEKRKPSKAPEEGGGSSSDGEGTVETRLSPHPLLYLPSRRMLDSAQRSDPGRKSDSAPPVSDGGKDEITVNTDSEGLASALLQLGSRNGDWNVEASIPKKGENVWFRVVSGVEKEVSDPESVVGAKVPIRLRLRHLTDEKDPQSLAPLPGRRVLFQVVGTPAGAMDSVDLKDKKNQTDAEGWRETQITLGQKPGVYQVLAEVEPLPGDEPIRGLVFSVVALDWVLTSFLLLTGIFVFLIGVRLLGNGFLLLTSPYVHLPTGPWSQSRFQGCLGGLLAGATFQSSSLVNSYLMSFANGGLLNAAGSLGLILGANVGATILPQILSLEIGMLAVPCLAVGTLLTFVRRRPGLQAWGGAFLGVGLILTGWSLLQHAAEITGLSTEFKTQVLFGEVDYRMPISTYAPRFFAYFCLGAAAGFFLRTSNLIVILAILLAASGVVLAPTAIPLVLGANLGAAAMVFVLSLRNRREARRLALLNLTSQVFGCAGAIVLSLVSFQGQSPFLQLVEWAAPGRLLSPLPSNVEQHVASAHTVYNFLVAALFLIFPGALLRPVNKLIPAEVSPDEVKPNYLDRNLIAVPALALRQVTEEVIYLTELCRKTVAEAFDSFRYQDLDLSEQVVRREEVISSLHRETSQYLVEVCENQLSRRDACQVEVLQTAVASLARIGELGERLRDLTARKIEEDVKGTEDMDRDLGEVYDLVMAQFSNILSLLRLRDTKTEENAVKMVERLAKFSSRVETQWRQRIEQSETPAKPVAIHLQTVIYQEAFGSLFRIASQLAHVAARMRILNPERF